MPPDGIAEKVAKLEVGLGHVESGLLSLGDKVDKLSAKIDGLTDKIGGLAERVANVEGQMKHIPSLWSVFFGQLAAAIAVAVMIIGAFNFGIATVKSAPTTAPAPTGPASAPDRGRDGLPQVNPTPSLPKP